MKKLPNAKQSKREGPIPLWRRPWFLSLIMVGIYFVLALAAYWPVYPGDPSRIVGCPCGDPAQSSWFLQWVPYAISHGHNPLFTSWINVPYGANLTQNTLMPLLGLIVAPLTALAGPVASFNLLAWLAFPLSAVTLFYVMRRLEFSRLAAFVAGLLYGFSPYMVGQGEGHIMLTFVPLPPLILLTSWELLIQQSKRPHKIGAILALEVIAQFLINPEVLVIAVLAVLLGVSILAIFRGYITRQRIGYAMRGLAVTTLICGLLLAYPIWSMISGPQHFAGPNFAPGNPYRSDLVGLVVPMKNQRFTLSYFHHYASTTADSDFSEVGDYVGIVLFAVICIAVIKWRKNSWLVFCAMSALLLWIGSLGPRLIVNTHRTNVILPFAVLTKLPLVQDLLPSRLSLAEWLFIAITAAIIINEWQKTRASKGDLLPSRRKKLTGACLILLAAITVLTLLPRWPYPTQSVDIPSYFKGNVSAIAGKSVLGYPFPVYTNDRFMLWQAESKMKFKLLGSYIQNPSLKGTETQLPPLLAPYSVQQWLAYEQDGTAITQWQPVSSITTEDITAYIKRNHVGAVVIDPQTVHANEVAKAFTTALGAPTLQGGVLVWSNLSHY